MPLHSFTFVWCDILKTDLRSTTNIKTSYTYLLCIHLLRENVCTYPSTLWIQIVTFIVFRPWENPMWSSYIDIFIGKCSQFIKCIFTSFRPKFRISYLPHNLIRVIWLARVHDHLCRVFCPLFVRVYCTNILKKPNIAIFGLLSISLQVNHTIGLDLEWVICHMYPTHLNRYYHLPCHLYDMDTDFQNGGFSPNILAHKLTLQ